ncbi:helix-turn-helix domain-containing protein [Maribacter sp. ACAM166]|uniref:helix-turn-helix domain-containing protein n=1 Tax=Maribacter sp. ACAM166 TaxID=2508996 RepID=UPI0010FD3AE8|nr:AraC family transcriptional regulator [Maribacter sp. ACAM166]TLP70619.1 helix-turn-helix transcriptional regulator [Maribacter sp. ACAM166]
MRQLIIRSSEPNAMFSQLQSCLKGELKEAWGERVFTFDNELGKGTIRTLPFSWGISLLDFDITLTDETKIIFDTQELSPIEFIFISKGFLKYNDNPIVDYTNFEKFQNIIISPARNAQKTFLFPKNENLKVNFIQIIRDEYLKKENNNISYLNDLLVSLFNDTNGDVGYQHRGSFSLRIADEIKQLNNVHDSGILRTLSLEGRLYLILSLQLLEHHNFEEKMNIPEAISKEEITRIHKLTEYILEHISENISINILSSESGLSPKKLQVGFKILYSKTVNEYIRQLKLEISRDYLKNTDLSVSEIVYAIGIKSRSYFSKIFFEAYEILPTEYRKQLKNKNVST